MSRSDTTIDWRATLTEALNAPGSLGTTYTRFYNYSFLNQIRLMMQGVAEPVATYNRWIELGRQVRKGSKAKVVLAPVLVGGDLKDGNGNIVIGSDGEPRKRQILVGFRDSRTVFGYSETDGDELPAVELPGWDTDTALGVLGIGRVAFDMVNGNVQGFSFEDDNGRHLALNRPLSTRRRHCCMSWRTLCSTIAKTATTRTAASPSSRLKRPPTSSLKS